MNAIPTKAWVCSVCGYIHYGNQPPEECPICGSSSDMFALDQSSPSEIAPQSGSQRVVIIGAGIAGLSAAEAVRKASSTAEIELISNESSLPYYRLNLTRYLAGEIGAADLPIHPEGWYAENAIRLVREATLSTIDLAEKALSFQDGSRKPFDRLILTTGSHPFRPPLPGGDKNNVLILRTWQDADALLAACQPGKAVVCIGGGLLGLETAGGLARRGVKVTVLENQDWLLPRQLNQAAAIRLEVHLGSLGIGVKTRAKTREFYGESSAREVVLENRERIPADWVVISAGIRSNIEIARQAGLAVNQGIVVDDGMQTSHPDVWAAGDVAEHKGLVYGIWPPSQMQGMVAGSNAAGQAATFTGVPRSNNLKVLGIDLYSIGRIQADPAVDRVVDGVVGEDYACFIFNQQRLVGAILLGVVSSAPLVKKAIESGQDCSAWLAPSIKVEDVLTNLG